MHEIVKNGFKLTNEDEVNSQLMNKCRLESIRILDNLQEWHLQHRSPEKDYPEFRFYLSDSLNLQEEFNYNIFETELNISYNINTHMQKIKVKKIRNSNYNELIELVIEVLTSQKNFVFQFFSAVQDIQKK